MSCSKKHGIKVSKYKNIGVAIEKLNIELKRLYQHRQLYLFS